jgi:bifunctional DNA-binding transcriptional regulator/antitoxin component of YhaV-PrlF toxin-antitoxin module
MTRCSRGPAAESGPGAFALPSSIGRRVGGSRGQGQNRPFRRERNGTRRRRPEGQVPGRVPVNCRHGDFQSPTRALPALAPSGPRCARSDSLPANRSNRRILTKASLHHKYERPRTGALRIWRRWRDSNFRCFHVFECVTKSRCRDRVYGMNPYRYTCPSRSITNAVAAAQISAIDKARILVRVILMSKVTSKLQVSVPKSLADRYGIQPGDDVQWEAAGEIIRMIPPRRAVPQRTRDERLEIFDQATRRQAQRQTRREVSTSSERGWSRDELYDRSAVAD